MSKKIGKNYMDQSEPLSKRLKLHHLERGSGCCCETVQTRKVFLGHPGHLWQVIR